MRASLLGRAIRAGAGRFPALPRRVASKPASLRGAVDRRSDPNSPEQRPALLGDCVADIALLEQTLGESFEDWRSAAGRGSFAERTANGQS